MNPELLNAVFYGDLSAVKALIEKENLTQFDLIYRGLEVDLPIYYLTQCNEILWNSNLFNEQYIPMVLFYRQLTREMMKYWQRFYHRDSFADIEYQNYWQNLSNRIDPAEVLECQLEPIGNYIEYGSELNDVKLMCAIERFNLSEVRELLNKGANPNGCVVDYMASSENDKFTCFKYVSEELSFLHCEQTNLFVNYHTKRVQEPIGVINIENLLSLSAFEEIYRLLLKC